MSIASERQINNNLRNLCHPAGRVCLCNQTAFEDETGPHINSTRPAMQEWKELGGRETWLPGSRQTEANLGERSRSQSIGSVVGRLKPLRTVTGRALGEALNHDNLQPGGAKELV